MAASLVRGAGYLIQRRLTPALEFAGRFGPRLWSARLLVLVTPEGPVIHRAAAKVATGVNAADNYWRTGNRLGAIDIATGQISRVVRGTGLSLEEDPLHPNTQQAIVGTAIPNWAQIVEEVKLAAQTFAGIRTQSWDIALADPAPTFLELNFGGDLNLHQLAHGQQPLETLRFQRRLLYERAVVGGGWSRTLRAAEGGGLRSSLTTPAHAGDCACRPGRRNGACSRTKERLVRAALPRRVPRPATACRE